jgi:nucleoid-associated protein YgaU
MVANWLKILLFAAGGSTAAVAMVYYTGIHDPWAVEESSAPMAAAEPDEPPAAVSQPREEVAPLALEDTTGEASPADPDEEPQAAPETPDEVAAVAAPEQSGANDDLVVPSFDIVRVEPNGSMVIAGSAEPNSDIEVVTGAEIIARAEVGPSGDFAAVLDDALRPGDYQIVLRSTGPGEGLVTTSLETAVVSVPETQDGQVLALVEEPGAPSRLITVPEVQAAAETTQEPPAVEAVPEIPVPSDELSDDTPSQTSPAEDSQEPSTEIAAADPDDALDPLDEVAPGTRGGDASVEPAPAPAGSDDTLATDEAEEPGEEPQLAARPAPRTSPTQDRPASPRNTLAVEAIEIEGGTVFVAGRGAAGTTVRVYANEILLGEARVSEGGRFLIETQTELPVGDYIVRADVIGPGGEVTARAAVPFQREPGEAVAAVAPAERTPAEAGTPAASQDSAQERVDPAEDGVAEIEDGTPAPTGGSAAQGSSLAQEQYANDDAATGDQASTDQPVGDEADAIAAAPSADRDAVQAADAMPQAAAIEETLAAPLEAADGAVIIRRGDTLWRISRRVYGRGVRYSTIYLANQEQIRDPDMIWPGQIFAVPDETEEGEKADMSTISDQIAPATDTR